MAETETLTIFLETRPRRDRDETLVRLETVSRPRRRDRDHNPATQARLIADTVAVVAVVAALPMITRHPATLGAKGENLQFFSHTHGVPFATNSGIKYFFTQIFSFKFPRFMYLFVLGRKSAKSRSWLKITWFRQPVFWFCSLFPSSHISRHPGKLPLWIIDPPLNWNFIR